MKSDPGEGKNSSREDNNSKREEKKKPNRGPIIVIAVIAFIIIAIFGVKALIYGSSHETTDDAQVDGDLVAITSKIAERIDAINVTTNSSVSRGELLIRLDQDDERRKYNQALATLNATKAQLSAATSTVSLTSDQQQAQVEQGNGGIAQAQAGVDSAVQQVSQAQDDFKVASSNVETARAQLESAEALSLGAAESERRADADFARIEKLARTGDASASDLDAARATAANARASYSQAKANIDVARASLRSALDKKNAQLSGISAARAAVALQQANVQSALGKRAEVSSPYRVAAQQSNAGAVLAQVAQQKALLQQAADQLSYTMIHSPIDGYVGEKNVEVGRTVSPGETLLTIVPKTGLFITANYKETQVGHIRPGQKVEINIDAYAGREIMGHVVAMPPASQATYSLIPAQNSTGNFVKVTQRLPVRIAVDSGIDADHPLRVGMSVETSVRIK